MAAGTNLFRRLAAVFAAAAFGCCAPAAASLTAVNPLGAGNGAERCLGGVACPAGGAYGGSLSLIGSFAAELGQGPLTRIDDAFDALWRATGNAVWVRPRARYAGDSSILGLDAGGGFQPLTSVQSNSTALVSNTAPFASDPRAADFAALAQGEGWTQYALAAGTHFAFVLRDITVNYKISSDPSRPGYANSGDSFLDYMVTYRVNDTVPHYFIAWEDRDPRAMSVTDHDYNDLVLEVLYAQPAMLLDAPLSPSPEPGTFALLLFGLGVLAATRRRR